MPENITIESSTLNTTVKESSLKIFLRFLRFGFLAWGGPVAQIAMIKRELVEEEKWISKERFNRALAVYQVLPGPEAHEMCVYFGMIAGGRWGGSSRSWLYAARLYFYVTANLVLYRIRDKITFNPGCLYRLSGSSNCPYCCRRSPYRQTCSY